MESLSKVMPALRMIAVSAKTGEGIDRVIDWLETKRGAMKSDARLSAET
jgi:Ni2+-binding GTPase involved in maturation of urease and hydrogenase